MLVKRMQLICDRLKVEGAVDIKSLSKELGVTEKTVRQDLIKMEEMELLERVRGGAVSRHHTAKDIFPIESRRKHHMDEKQRIAEAAVGLIKDGDIVILDNGTTTQALAKLIKNMRIRVITNDLAIINELVDSASITLYATGGKLHRNSEYCSFVGQDTIRMIRQKHANIAFIGTSAFSLEQGLMIFSEEEVEVKRMIIKSSIKKVCLADSTKLGKIALSCFAEVQEMDVIITDTNADANELNKIEQGGVQVIAV